MVRRLLLVTAATVALLAAAVVVPVGLEGTGGPAGRVAGAKVQAQAVAQSYTADSPLQAGMIVMLADPKTKVKPVDRDQADHIHGVIVRPNDTALSLSQGEPDQFVYVATTGTYKVLASTQNGAIKEGDYVVVSAIEGIGMKVDDASQFVVGKALSNFDGSGNVLSTTTIKDTAGHERTVHIGYVNADINIGKNPLHKGAVSSVPALAQKVADVVAGKPVSGLRVYLGMAVAIITGIIVSSIMYAGVKASIIALGRNPLARKSIIRNLLLVMVLGLIILTVGLLAVYLLLKL